MRIRYVTLSEALYIHGLIAGNVEILSGKQKVREIEGLQAAIARPQMSVFGEDAYPTLAEKGSALLHSIVRNHPFKDGNKRSGTVAMLFMFEINGCQTCWQATEALQNILALAEGKEDMHTFSQWLSFTAREPRFEADEALDIQHMQAIIQQHQWLLDELNKR
ncbi:hypothetical protein MASR2M15_27280 [Anaerolineales bacterium]